jgi:hypothetical protein
MEDKAINGNWSCDVDTYRDVQSDTMKRKTKIDRIRPRNGGNVIDLKVAQKPDTP